MCSCCGWIDACVTGGHVAALVCASVHEERLTCCTTADLIPEICDPMTTADGSVSRLKSQQLTLRQPKHIQF